MNLCRFRKASGKPFHVIINQHLALSAKRTGTMMLAMYVDEATLSSEEIKPIALSIVELCLAEGISQSVSRKFSQHWLDIAKPKNIFTLTLNPSNELL